MQQIYRKTLIPKFDFNNVAKHLYWYHTSAQVFSCKFAAYFQNQRFLRTSLDGYFLIIPTDGNYNFFCIFFKLEVYSESSQLFEMELFARKFW